VIALYRVDDRLVHGQVVLGWGQSLHADFIVLVDDAVARSDWEQELYRLGVPPEMDLIFATVAEAGELHESWVAERRVGILLTPDLDTMNRLLGETPGIGRVNLGGIHHRPGREQKLRYVYLNRDEQALLREMADRGVEITAQDVPATHPIPLREVLGGRGGDGP
jgi:mannose/fructose/N-acetylgalactosamine-specific phosphotransferase system component IIB